MSGIHWSNSSGDHGFTPDRDADEPAAPTINKTTKAPAKAPAPNHPALSRAGRQAARAEGYQQAAELVNLCADAGALSRVLDFLAAGKTAAEVKPMLPLSLADLKRAQIAARRSRTS